MKRRLVHRLAALVCAAGTTLTLAACTSDSSDSKTYSFDGATKIGSVIPKADRKPAPAIEAQLLDGGSTTLASRKGKIVVMPFWASWCGPCRVEMPSLQDDEKQLASKGVTLLGVNTKDDRDAAKSFLQGNKVTFPSVYDQPGDVAADLGNIPGSLPFTVLVDGRGEVAAVYIGRYSPVDLNRAVAKLRAEG
ncbi:TlpA family protein disulfide reductase [Jatrophihabitans fulvus]